MATEMNLTIENADIEAVRELIVRYGGRSFNNEEIDRRQLIDLCNCVFELMGCAKVDDTFSFLAAKDLIIPEEVVVMRKFNLDFASIKAIFKAGVNSLSMIRALDTQALSRLKISDVSALL